MFQRYAPRAEHLNRPATLGEKKYARNVLRRSNSYKTAVALAPFIGAGLGISTVTTIASIFSPNTEGVALGADICTGTLAVTAAIAGFNGFVNSRSIHNNASFMQRNYPDNPLPFWVEDKGCLEKISTALEILNVASLLFALPTGGVTLPAFGLFSALWIGVNVPRFIHGHKINKEARRQLRS